MIDPSIPLQVKQFQPPDRMNMMAQVMGIQQAQNQNELATYSLGKAKRLDGQTNALMDALQGGLDISTPEGQAKALAIAPEAAQAHIKARLENQKTTAQIGERNATAKKAELESTFQKFSHAGSVLSQVKDPASYATARQMLNTQLGMNLPEQYDPTMVQQTIAQGQTVTQHLQAERERMTLAETTQHNRATEGNAAGQLAESGRHNRSTESLTARGQNMANDRAGETLKKDYAVAGINKDGTPVDGGGLLSPESVINAATRYNMDGTLPPNLGRGTQGPRQTAQILNEAARQAAARGDSPESQRIAQLANKANAQAMGTIEKQSTMVGAFEKNFTKNADIALELSQKVDRTGVPILNKWINAGRRSVAGDAELAAFDANIKATVNEYAKIVGGGTGSGATAQGEIAKIEGLLSSAQTPKQVEAVISLMKRETANRLQAFEEQKAELRNSMIHPGSAKPAAPAPAAPAAGKGWTYIGPVK